MFHLKATVIIDFSLALLFSISELPLGTNFQHCNLGFTYAFSTAVPSAIPLQHRLALQHCAFKSTPSTLPIRIGTSALSLQHCPFSTALHTCPSALPLQHCPICTAPSALPLQHCPLSIAPSALPLQHCPFITALSTVHCPFSTLPL